MASKLNLCKMVVKQVHQDQYKMQRKREKMKQVVLQAHLYSER